MTAPAFAQGFLKLCFDPGIINRRSRLPSFNCITDGLIICETARECRKTKRQPAGRAAAEPDGCSRVFPFADLVYSAHDREYVSFQTNEQNNPVDMNSQNPQKVRFHIDK